MHECTIVDTFPAFLTFWSEVQHKPLDALMESWASQYMAHWPELLQKQVADYASENEDWRQIARERVFPFLGQRLPTIRDAHTNLLQLAPSIYCTAQQVLGFESDAVFVIYVGIGCGAGWATSYHGLPAILFGLENIAECGWSQPPSLTGLVAHEIGHLAHQLWRAQQGTAQGCGPWWQLYEEGFAQRCEHLILGCETWHPACGINAPDWLDWCHQHKDWLAAEFLRLAEAGQAARPFFGSWYDIRGRRQCGYFLGHELIRQLETTASLRDIALLSNVEQHVRPILLTWARQGTVPAE